MKRALVQIYWDHPDNIQWILRHPRTGKRLYQLYWNWWRYPFVIFILFNPKKQVWRACLFQAVLDYQGMYRCRKAPERATMDEAIEDGEEGMSCIRKKGFNCVLAVRGHCSHGAKAIVDERMFGLWRCVECDERFID